MDPQSLTKDFREFLQSLNGHGVDYLVIGGHAVAYHGYPRATADLDVWVAVHPDNAARFVEALLKFGFAVRDLTADLFLRPEVLASCGGVGSHPKSVAGSWRFR